MQKISDVGIVADEKSSRSVFSVRLPGFVSEAEIGLGDVIKRATSSMGITTCGGCERRAALLNRWVSFKGGVSKNINRTVK